MRQTISRINSAGVSLKGRLLGRRLVAAATWATVGAVVARASGLLAAICTARVLGQEDFGKVGMVQSTVGLLGTFAGFGLGVTASKFVAEYRQTDPVRTGRIITLADVFALAAGGLMAGLLIVGAPFLAIYTIGAPALVSPLRISAALLFLSSIIGAQSGTLSGLEAFRTLARTNVQTATISFVLTTTGAALSGVEGAIWGMTAGLGANWILNHIALRALLPAYEIPWPVHGFWRERGILWRFSVPSVLGSSATAPSSWACNALLVSRGPSGFSEMAIINAACQWRTAILFVPGTIGSALLPIFSSLSAEGHATFPRLVKYSVLSALCSGLLVAVPVAVLARPAMAAYGEAFATGAKTLAIVALASAIIAGNNQLSRVLAATGRMWTSCLFDASWGITFIVSGFILIPRLGCVGWAVAFLLAAALQLTVQSLWTFGHCHSRIPNDVSITNADVACIEHEDGTLVKN